MNANINEIIDHINPLVSEDTNALKRLEKGMM